MRLRTGLILAAVLTPATYTAIKHPEEHPYNRSAAVSRYSKQLVNQVVDDGFTGIGKPGTNVAEQVYDIGDTVPQYEFLGTISLGDCAFTPAYADVKKDPDGTITDVSGYSFDVLDDDGAKHDLIVNTGRELAGHVLQGTCEYRP